MDENRSESGADRGDDIAALEILGAFLFVLGCAMVVAVFWPPTWAGRLTNSLVALFLLVLGGMMFRFGRAARVRSAAPREDAAAVPSRETGDRPANRNP